MQKPIAEVYLKSRHPELNAYSSGLWALVGKPADPASVSLMSAKEISLESHSGRLINSILVSRADLILTMEQRYLDAIHNKFSVSGGKVHLVGK